MSQQTSKPLDGRIAVITGAAGGMGISIAQLLAAQGASLALIDKDEARLSETTETLRQAGTRCDAFVCDLGDPEAIAATAVAVTSSVGSPDILVNNAGMLPKAQGLDAIQAEVWDLMFRINVRGAFLCAQHFGAPMLARGSGSIVNVGSIAARLPNAHGAYGPTKAAILALTRQLAVEWGPRGVRANSVSPGMIYTPMTTTIYEDPEVLGLRSGAVAMRRIGAADDIAQAIFWLASDASGYVNGQNIEVDGGFAMTALMRLQPKDQQPQPPY